MKIAKPMLSICVPTLNRSAFLRQCLAHLQESYFPFDIEIVVSDNASSDETADVAEHFNAAGLPVSYHKQHHTVPAYENLCCALRLSRGKYSIILCDDDYLIPDALVAAVMRMEAMPGISAMFTPLVMYDEMSGKETGLSFTGQMDIVSNLSEFLSFFDHVARYGISTDIGLYRSSVISNFAIPRFFNAPVFVQLVSLMLQGVVVLSCKPFYRFVQVSKLNPTLNHVGTNLAIESFNHERGALEEFLILAAAFNNYRFTEQQLADLTWNLEAVELTRMQTAIRLCIKHRHYLRAYELYTRARLTMLRRKMNLSESPEMLEASDLLYGRAAADAVSHGIATMTNVNRLIMVMVPDAQGWLDVFMEIGLHQRITIEIVDNPTKLVGLDMNSVALLVRDFVLAQELEDIGFRAGQIFDATVFRARYVVDYNILGLEAPPT